MRTLLVCREAPFPPTTGSPLRLWQHVNVLSSLGPVSVFSFGSSGTEQVPAPLLDQWIHIRTDQSQGRRLPLILRPTSLLNPNQFPDVGAAADRTLNEQLRAFVERVRPDLIVLSHWVHAMPSALRGRYPLIVDSHNVESKLWYDSMNTKGLGTRLRYWNFRRREVSLFNESSRTWVTSDVDKALLERMSRTKLSVSVWPNAIDLSPYRRDQLDAAVGAAHLDRSFPTLIFVGYMAYQPNHDAAMFLISEILPAIRQTYPGVRLLVVGKNPHQALIDRACRERNVIVTGMVDDVRPYLAISDISVVPLLVGGGTRIKLLEAFASRVAVVSTSKGAEGIATAESDVITIADTPKELILETLRLLSDEGRRMLQTLRAYELVRSQFSWEALRHRLPDELSSLVTPDQRATERVA